MLSSSILPFFHPFPSPTFVLATTTIVLTPTGTTCCAGRGHVGGKSPEFVPALVEQRVTQTKWLKRTLKLHSDRFRERSDVTGEPLCGHQGTAIQVCTEMVHDVKGMLRWEPVILVRFIHPQNMSFIAKSPGQPEHLASAVDAPVGGSMGGGGEEKEKSKATAASVVGAMTSLKGSVLSVGTTTTGGGGGGDHHHVRNSVKTASLSSSLSWHAARKQEIIKATEQLIDCINSGDFEGYT
ncbi:Calcium/calmodulin-dependent protein kinase type II delta chain [Portunus trituberculatus]|uniref:Calcium/calmodulin-dependent protein kinase type II delta chain n=1 Tax=Portunus trituberculatus TaxID=210409 RepID=A0A5B7ED49_PORTR|nr:Calcium/calmodulin-dependent protein kinase type II delta chain [Portunus trituberculatus]